MENETYEARYREQLVKTIKRQQEQEQCHSQAAYYEEYMPIRPYAV
ncbi:MAG TPA: hypothetical protein VD905_11680 [Flavobacteriales bacterium]|nr:hypothetical protein [Flavobacteriales bacterium]